MGVFIITLVEYVANEYFGKEAKDWWAHGCTFRLRVIFVIEGKIVLLGDCTILMLMISSICLCGILFHLNILARIWSVSDMGMLVCKFVISNEAMCRFNIPLYYILWFFYSENSSLLPITTYLLVRGTSAFVSPNFIISILWNVLLIFISKQVLIALTCVRNKLSFIYLNYIT